MNTGETIVAVMLFGLLSLLMIVFLFVTLELYEHVPKYWNKFKNSLKRKTDLEKEIEEVQRDINELKKQIEQLEELEELKRCKEDLFEKVERDTQ